MRQFLDLLGDEWIELAGSRAAVRALADWGDPALDGLVDLREVVATIQRRGRPEERRRQPSWACPGRALTRACGRASCGACRSAGGSSSPVTCWTGVIGWVAPQDPGGRYGRLRVRPSAGSPGAEMNSVRLAGRVARAPQLHLSKKQLEVCVLELAVGRRRRDGEQAPFSVDVVTFGAMARHAVSLALGQRVRVAGRLDRREWTTRDGSARSCRPGGGLACEPFGLPAFLGRAGCVLTTLRLPTNC